MAHAPARRMATVPRTRCSAMTQLYVQFDRLVTNRRQAGRVSLPPLPLYLTDRSTRVAPSDVTTLQPIVKLRGFTPISPCPQTVFAVSDGLKVFGVDAISHTAQVVQNQSLRDRPFVPLIVGTVGKHALILTGKVHDAVRVSLLALLPYPTWRRKTPVLFNVFNWGQACLMATNIAGVLSLYEAPFVGRVRGKRGGFTASAHARSRGVGGTLEAHCWSLHNRFRGAMPRAATNSAGAFRVPLLYQIPRRFGRFSRMQGAGGGVATTPNRPRHTENARATQEHRTPISLFAKLGSPVRVRGGR